MFPDRSYIRASVLFGFDKLVTDLGGNPDQLLRKCNMESMGALCPDSLVSFRSYAQLLETAAFELNQPNFGIRFAETSQPNFPTLGAIHLLAYFAGTIKDWLQSVVSHLTIFTNAFGLQISVDPGAGLATIRIETHGPVLLSRQKAEHTVAVAMLVLRSIIDRPDWSPQMIRFVHDAPLDRSLHNKIFMCPIEFSADFTEVVVPLDHLDLPIRVTESGFRRAVDQFIRSRNESARRLDQSVTAMVESAVVGLLGGGCCSIELVANILSMHEKKLQRLLAQEETSYAAILDATRRRQAAHLLTRAPAAISTIARMLDYDSMPAFSNAFRRWYGTTPRAFRQTETAQGSVVYPVEYSVQHAMH